MTISNRELRSGRRQFLSRWKALTSIGFTLSSLVAAVPLFANELSPSQAAHTGEKRPGLPPPPPAADPQDQNASNGIDPQTAKRVMAAKNEKEFREGVQKLFEMATELRDELGSGTQNERPFCPYVQENRRNRETRQAAQEQSKGRVIFRTAKHFTASFRIPRRIQHGKRELYLIG